MFGVHDFLRIQVFFDFLTAVFFGFETATFLGLRTATRLFVDFISFRRL